MIQNPQLMPQHATPNASAVNIQIFSPQAYAYPNGQQVVAPQQLDKQIYNYPQASLYQPGQQPYGYQVVQAPAPQVMPQPLLQQPAEQVKPAEAEQNQAPAQPAQQPEINSVPTNEPVVPQNAVDLNALTAGLQSEDINTQTDTITKVAQLSQSTPDVARQVVDNQIMQSLIGIIQKDTSQLEGPNQQQVEIAKKLNNGQQLTPEEQAVFEQSSPKELAEKNKVFAMFTLAMLQKSQRDEIDEYNAQTPDKQVAPVKINELAGYNEILNTISTTQIPAVKVAGIQALSYVARPEDKATVEAVFNGLVNDPDQAVQEAAKEAISKLAAPEAQAPQAAPAPEAQAPQAAPAPEAQAPQAAPAQA